MDSNKIVSGAAIFISLLTLLIFIYQTQLMREQSRLSVMPRVGFNEISNYSDTTNFFQYEIINKGLGPGVIESLKIRYDNEVVGSDFDAFIDEYIPELNKITTQRTTSLINSGSTISAGEAIILLRVGVPDRRLKSYHSLLEEKNILYDFDIEIIYASMYNEKWKVSLRADNPNPVKL